MISFGKSISGQVFAKQLTGKKGELDSDEIIYGGRSTGERGVTRKLAVSGLSFTQMNSMYVGNVWVRAIVDKTVERSTDIPPLIKPIRMKQGDDPKNTGKLDEKTKKNMDAIYRLITDPNSMDESFNDIRKKVTRDILKYDAGAIEIVTGKRVDGKGSNIGTLQRCCTSKDENLQMLGYKWNV